MKCLQGASVSRQHETPHVPVPQMSCPVRPCPCLPVFGLLASRFCSICRDSIRFSTSLPSLYAAPLCHNAAHLPWLLRRAAVLLLGRPAWDASLGKRGQRKQVRLVQRGVDGSDLPNTVWTPEHHALAEGVPGTLRGAQLRLQHGNDAGPG